MEKRADNSVQDNKSSLNLEDRKKLTLSGVVEVMSFDEEKIDLTTKLGNLTIKGEELKMNKLDVQNGDVYKRQLLARIGKNCPRRKSSPCWMMPVSYTHLRAHETKANLVCRLLLEKKKKKNLMGFVEITATWK